MFARCVPDLGESRSAVCDRVFSGSPRDLRLWKCIEIRARPTRANPANIPTGLPLEVCPVRRRHPRAAALELSDSLRPAGLSGTASRRTLLGVQGRRRARPTLGNAAPG